MLCLATITDLALVGQESDDELAQTVVRGCRLFANGMGNVSQLLDEPT